MWETKEPWIHLGFRAVIIYFFVFILLRFLGKKQIGKLSPFDLVLLLIISESVSSALSGGDNSLTAGLLLSFVLISINFIVDFLSFKSRKIEKAIEGEAVFLVRDGQLQSENLQQQHVSFMEFSSSLREHGLENLNQVKHAILETNGKVSVIEYEKEEGTAKTSRSLLESPSL